MVQNTGKFVFSFAAKTAALASYKSIIVSIIIKFAPDFSPCIACLLNISYALSKLKVPIGSNISPIGPKSRATNLGLDLSDSSIAFLAIFIALSTTSSTVYPNLSNLSSLAPNVLVVITFEPASKYNLCISISLSGFFNPNISGFSPI